MLTVSWPALRACLCMGIKPSRVTLFAQPGVGSTPRLDSDVARLVDHNGLLRLPTSERAISDHFFWLQRRWLANSHHPDEGCQRGNGYHGLRCASKPLL